MKNLLTKIGCLLFIAAYNACLAQSIYDSFQKLQFGTLKIGYKVESCSDNSRTFNKKTDYFGNTILHNNRQIQVQIWYPAIISESDQPIHYKEYIQESITLNGTNPGDLKKAGLEKLSDYKEKLFAKNLDSLTIEKFLMQQTNAYWNPENHAGKFPLIIYAPSINSDPIENVALIEYLVSYGYVVVSASSVGHNSLAVTRDVLGAETQLRDLEFILDKSWDLNFVDTNSIFAIGFSWGGMSSILLALKNTNITGVISLDGAQGFNEYYDICSAFSCFHPNNFTASYLGFVPTSESRICKFVEFIKYGDVINIKIANVKHKDFSSDLLLLKAVQKTQKVAEIEFLFNFYRSICETILDFIKIASDAHKNFELSPLTGMKRLKGDIQIEVKKKLPAPPTEAEFLNIIRTQGAQDAVKLFDSIRNIDSAAVFFSEKSIIAFAFEFGPERAKDLIDLLKMNLTVYPNSVESFLWLAQSHMAMNQNPDALTYLDKVKQLDPNNNKAEKLILLINATK